MLNTVESLLAEAIKTVRTAEFYERLARYLRGLVDYDNIIALVCAGTAGRSGKPVVLYKESRGPNVFSRLEMDYLAGAYMLDPFYQLHLDRAKPGIYRLMEIAPDQFLRSRYYNWYYGRLGITDEITIFRTFGEDSTATISIGRAGSAKARFSASAEKRLRSSEPVILALIEAHWADVKSPAAAQSETEMVSEFLIEAMRRQHKVALTRRQAEVALLILKGHSSLSAGMQLQISPKTVKVFRRQLYQRCNISSQAELFLIMIPLLTVT